MCVCETMEAEWIGFYYTRRATKSVCVLVRCKTQICPFERELKTSHWRRGHAVENPRFEKSSNRVRVQSFLLVIFSAFFDGLPAKFQRAICCVTKAVTGCGDERRDVADHP